MQLHDYSCDFFRLPGRALTRENLCRELSHCGRLENPAQRHFNS